VASPALPVFRLPVFPLPLVLLPGAPLPLHIFEPRYRAMLADCMAGDRRFGILFRPEGLEETDLLPGDVGCVAHVETVKQLPDGRSNILVTGQDRFALAGWVETPHPYHVANVAAYADEAESPDDLAPLAAEVTTLFARAARAARTLASDPDPVPKLPDDPGLMSFSVAAYIDLPPEFRQTLLASRSPATRLRELRGLLRRAVAPIESRAAVHTQARANGSGPRPA
jgi:Lon protease-like protein